MKPTSFDPNDPRLTAWLLDELPASERPEFEAWINAHPEVRDDLESLRTASEKLRDALAAEEVPLQRIKSPSLSFPSMETVGSGSASAAPVGSAMISSVESTGSASPTAFPASRNRKRSAKSIVAAALAIAGCAITGSAILSIQNQGQHHDEMRNTIAQHDTPIKELTELKSELTIPSESRFERESFARKPRATSESMSGDDSDASHYSGPQGSSPLDNEESDRYGSIAGIADESEPAFGEGGIIEGDSGGGNGAKHAGGQGGGGRASGLGMRSSKPVSGGKTLTDGTYNFDGDSEQEIGAATSPVDYSENAGRSGKQGQPSEFGISSQSNSGDGKPVSVRAVVDSLTPGDSSGRPLGRSKAAAARGEQRSRNRTTLGEEGQSKSDGWFENSHPEGLISEGERVGGEVARLSKRETPGYLPSGPKGFKGRESKPTSTIDQEEYAPLVFNPFLSPSQAPLSTFGVDVDTASYSNVRRFLTSGQFPPPQAVRVEELLNYFRYDEPAPAGEIPFSVSLEAAHCPWNPEHQLVRIGLAGKEIPQEKRPPANLVFLVDVSGSMQAENKLPLVRHSLKLLLSKMEEQDHIAIVTYSDTAKVVLPSQSAVPREQIAAVIDSLTAAGSTNGAAGIQLAYNEAVHHFVNKGINRVILCTDGDFNVGTTNDSELVKLIEERRRSQVFFSVYGYGMGNLKDGKLEQLADHGNGHYGYIDGPAEAQKAFVEDAQANLVTIAQDVKIQVEFNPQQVGRYRLIGYENRVMAASEFRNDKKDAGDIGAGHRVTALYEIVPTKNIPIEKTGLRYEARAVVDGEVAKELLTVRLRYKLPGEETAQEIQQPLVETGSAPSRNMQWASAVAGFGMLLRNTPERGNISLPMILELAESNLGEDPAGHRKEFVALVRRAEELVKIAEGHPDHNSDPGSKSPGETAPGVSTPGLSPKAPSEKGARRTQEEAEKIASQNGKYRNLLRVLSAPEDVTLYGEISNYGPWNGTSYREHTQLPAGFWVYVAPNWYIWGENDAPK